MNPSVKQSDKARRAQHAAQYAPRTRPVVARPTVKEPDVVLKKLTAKVLDELKKPGVVPSAVILQALEQAQALVKQR